MGYVSLQDTPLLYTVSPSDVFMVHLVEAPADPVELDSSFDAMAHPVSRQLSRQPSFPGSLGLNLNGNVFGHR